MARAEAGNELASPLLRVGLDNITQDIQQLPRGPLPDQVQYRRVMNAGLQLGQVDPGAVVASYLGAPGDCLLYTSPSPRDLSTSRMPSSA